MAGSSEEERHWKMLLILQYLCKANLYVKSTTGYSRNVVEAEVDMSEPNATALLASVANLEEEGGKKIMPPCRNLVMSSRRRRVG